MATYIQGVTDFLPQVQPWEPDFNFFLGAMEKKQQQYDAGWQKVNTLYNSMLNAPMMRDDNISKRNHYFNQIANDIQRLSSLDLSLPQNVTAAGEVFEPIVSDKYILNDMSWTKKYMNEMQMSEYYRNCTDPKKCGNKYWDTGVKALNYMAQDFRTASADDALNMRAPRYVPYSTALEDVYEKIKNSGFGKVKRTSMSDDGRYMMIETNGGQEYLSSLMGYLTQTLGNNPEVSDMYWAKAYTQRKDWMSMNGGNFETPELAEAEYYKALVDPALYGLTAVQEQVADDVRDKEIIMNEMDKVLQNEGIIPGSDEHADYLRIQQEAAELLGIKQGVDESINNAVNVRNNSSQAARLYNSDAAVAQALMYGDLLNTALTYQGLTYELEVKADEYALAGYKASLDANLAAYRSQLNIDEYLSKKIIDWEGQLNGYGTGSGTSSGKGGFMGLGMTKEEAIKQYGNFSSVLEAVSKMQAPENEPNVTDVSPKELMKDFGATETTLMGLDRFTGGLLGMNTAEILKEKGYIPPQTEDTYKTNIGEEDKLKSEVFSAKALVLAGMLNTMIKNDNPAFEQEYKSIFGNMPQYDPVAEARAMVQEQAQSPGRQKYAGVTEKTNLPIDYRRSDYIAHLESDLEGTEGYSTNPILAEERARKHRQLSRSLKHLQGMITNPGNTIPGTLADLKAKNQITPKDILQLPPEQIDNLYDKLKHRVDPVYNVDNKRKSFFREFVMDIYGPLRDDIRVIDERYDLIKDANKKRWDEHKETFAIQAKLGFPGQGPDTGLYDVWKFWIKPHTPEYKQFAIGAGGVQGNRVPSPEENFVNTITSMLTPSDVNLTEAYQTLYPEKDKDLIEKALEPIVSVQYTPRIQEDTPGAEVFSNAWEKFIDIAVEEFTDNHGRKVPYEIWAHKVNNKLTALAESINPGHVKEMKDDMARFFGEDQTYSALMFHDEELKKIYYGQDQDEVTYKRGTGNGLDDHHWKVWSTYINPYNSEPFLSGGGHSQPFATKVYKNVDPLLPETPNWMDTKTVFLDLMNNQDAVRLAIGDYNRENLLNIPEVDEAIPTENDQARKLMNVVEDYYENFYMNANKGANRPRFTMRIANHGNGQYMVGNLKLDRDYVKANAGSKEAPGLTGSGSGPDYETYSDKGINFFIPLDLAKNNIKTKSQADVLDQIVRYNGKYDGFRTMYPGVANFDIVYDQNKEEWGFNSDGYVVDINPTTGQELKIKMSQLGPNWDIAMSGSVTSFSAIKSHINQAMKQHFNYIQQQRLNLKAMKGVKDKNQLLNR